MDSQISILETAKGAILERANFECSKVLQNILDPNTNATKKRTVKLQIEFVPSSDRTQVNISVTADCKLQPSEPIQTALYVGGSIATGELVATELVPNIPGQIGIDGTEQEHPKIIKLA